MSYILVTGGTGFLGTAICKALISKNKPVVSLSRQLPLKPLEGVQYLLGDVLLDETWKALPQNCRAVIHTVGILKEKKSKNITYDRFIFMACQKAADWAETQGYLDFIYISARKPPPFVLRDYYRQKLKSESYLLSKKLKFQILRPGILTNWEKPLVHLVALPWEFAASFLKIANKVSMFQNVDKTAQLIAASLP